jgi:hypothetical protein
MPLDLLLVFMIGSLWTFKWLGSELFSLDPLELNALLLLKRLRMFPPERRMFL